MSGGHYQYQYRKIEYLASEIEEEFKDGGEYLSVDYSDDSFHNGKRKMKKYHYLSDATDEQKILILNEIKKLVNDLRCCAAKAKELEWYLSDDTDGEIFLKNIIEINQNKQR